MASYERGISLLEVLIAFSILSISLGVILQSTGASARHHRLLEHRLIAASHASSIAARVGLDIPLTIGKQSDVIDETYQWQVVVSKDHNALERASLASETDIFLRSVSIAIIWHDGTQDREFRTNTKRLVRPQ